MTSPRTPHNKAKHWNDRIAQATTDQERAGVWFDACRTLAIQAQKAGKPDLYGPLTTVLHNFFKQHGG